MPRVAPTGRAVELLLSWLQQFGRSVPPFRLGCHPFAIYEKGAAMRIVGVTGGIDTHADHHMAAVDDNGGLLGIESFPATEAGYEGLLAWLTGHVEVIRGWCWGIIYLLSRTQLASSNLLA